MRIGVCVKQVPAGSARMDGETGLLIRDSVGGTLNPYDLFALEAALQAAQGAAQQAAQKADEAIRAGSAATRRAGGRGEVFAITMGPPPAEQALREALALGADAAVLLSDPAFSGADVAATSRALAEGVRKYGVPDLIFCGRQTTDGDTAQLPFALAARLGLPVVGWVTGIEYFREDGYSVVQELSGGAARVRGAYPALFAVGREAVQPRPPSLTRRLVARKLPLIVWSLADLDRRDPQDYGLAGSPTRVRNLYTPEQAAKTPPLRVEAAEAAALIRAARLEW